LEKKWKEEGEGDGDSNGWKREGLLRPNSRTLSRAGRIRKNRKKVEERPERRKRKGKKIKNNNPAVWKKKRDARAVGTKVSL